MTPREKWTDERLDDRFAQADNELRELREDVKGLRQEINERFARIVQRRLDAMHRLFVGSVVVIVALISLTGTLIGVHAF